MGDTRPECELNCSQCGESLVPGAAFCEACGAPVTPGRPNSCANCGAALEPDMAFCESCGAAVNAIPAALPPAPSPVTRGSGSRKALVIGGAIGALGIGGALAFFLFQGDDSTPAGDATPNATATSPVETGTPEPSETPTAAASPSATTTSRPGLTATAPPTAGATASLTPQATGTAGATSTSAPPTSSPTVRVTATQAPPTATHTSVPPSATSVPSVPAAPSGLTMTRAGAPDPVGFFTYTMSWNDNANNESGFRVYNFDQFATLPANTTFFEFGSSELPSFNPDPCFAVTAFNAAGESAAASFCFPN